MQAILKISKNPFWGDSLLFSISSGLVNILNFAFVLLAAHFLSKPEFGTFNSLLSAVTLAAVMGTALQLHVVGLLSRTPASTQAALWQRLVRNCSALNLAGVCCVALLILLFGPVLGASRIEVLAACVCVAAFSLSALANGLTSGLQRMKVQGVVALLSTMLKLIVAVPLLYFGLGISGAFLAYIVCLLSVFFVTHYWFLARQKMAQDVNPVTLNSSKAGSPLLLTCTFALLIMPFSLDQVLTQSFSRDLSGDYGGLVTVGKIIFYLSTPILGVIYSYLANCGHDKARQIRLVQVGAGLCLVLTGIGVTALGLFPEVALHLLLPAQYLALAPLVFLFALGPLMYSVSYAITSYFLVRSEGIVLLPLAIASTVQPVLFWYYHESLAALVGNQLIAYAVQLLMVLACFVYAKRKT